MRKLIGMASFGAGRVGGRGDSVIRFITATTYPVLVGVNETQTPSDGFTAGVYETSAEGASISGTTTAYFVNGTQRVGSYDINAGDVMYVTQTVTDSSGNERVFRTATVTVMPAVALSNTALPSIAGTPSVTEVLTASTGTWAGSAPRTFAYQWTRDGVPIDGATASNYMLMPADELTEIGCEVTADDGFTQVTAVSNAVFIPDPSSYSGNVITVPHGQSNAEGLGDPGDLDVSLKGQFDRTHFFNASYPNDPETFDLTLVHQLAGAGETVDGVVGRVNEYGGSGLTSLHYRAVQAGDGGVTPYLPNVNRWAIMKVASGGTEQEAFSPVDAGGQWNSLDGLMRVSIDALIAQDAVEHRISDFQYIQGERDAVNAVINAQDANGGSTDPAVVIPAALADDEIALWAERQAPHRRALREVFGIMNAPYVIQGPVLPDLDGGQSYGDNGGNALYERAREGILVQQMNLARWLVVLDPGETSITVTDLGTNLRTISYNSGTDDFTVTVTGTPAPYKDDRTYVVLGRGYSSADDLHWDADASIKLGKAQFLLMEHIYGAGGVPSAANTFTEALPYFYEPPAITANLSDTSAEFEFRASELGTVYAAAYPSGTTAPTSAEVIAGTGASATASAASARRLVRTVTVNGLTAETDYDFYFVVSSSGTDGVVSEVVEVTTAEEVASGISLVSTESAQLAREEVAGDTTTVPITGAQEGDLMLLVMVADVSMVDANPNEGVVSAGWTNLFNRGTENPGFGIWYKVAGATPDTSVEVYQRFKQIAAATRVYRGVDTTTPIDAGPEERLYGASVAPDPQPITTVTDGALSVIALAVDDVNTTPLTPPSGYGNLVELDAGEVNSLSATLGLCDAVAGLAGTVDPGPWSYAVQDSASTVHFALRPAL